MRIGYAPNSPDLSGPADRRRFPFYAERRGLTFEVADPTRSYDLVVVTPRADLERWSTYRPGGPKVVFDIVDSYLEIPRRDPKALLRGPAKWIAGEVSSPFFSYRGAVERMLERADAATFATPEQAQAAATLCPNGHAILDFHSGIVRKVKQDYAAGTPLHLVWEGLSENVRWFAEIAAALAEAHRQHPLALHLVTALEHREFVQRFWRRQTSRLAARHFEHVRLYQWSEEMVSVIATACDIAVIPLPLDRPFAAGKPENKLISFWRMGMPVVTSATPAYLRAMAGAGQDLCCSSSRQWVDRILTLAQDEPLRTRAGTGGRQFAEEHHSEQRILEAWDGVLASL